jgi:hypothetical protein
MVEANGRNIFLPKKRNLTSPGRCPIPNRSSHGNNEENTINTRNMIINQRIIDSSMVVNTHFYS